MPKRNRNWRKARKSFFDAGGVESNLGPQDKASYYWERAAIRWRRKAENLAHTPPT